MATSSEDIGSESVESLSPTSITITDRNFTDSSRVGQFQREREATEYMRRMSVDERFFKGPIAVPKKDKDDPPINISGILHAF